MLKRLIDSFIDRTESVIIDKAIQKASPLIEDAVSETIEAIANDEPKVRSTGGATSVLLEKIQKDFEDFHPDDANSDIQTFVLELLQVMSCQIKDFDKAKVSDKVKLNINKAPSRLSNVKINQIAIADYNKSLYSATITYRVSFGFDQGGTRREKLYEVEYTLQLRDEFGEAKYLECSYCGAPLEENTGCCKYCGMKHVRDTISNWVVTGFNK